MYSSSAYAPFGEQYSKAGTADASYTGQDQDTVSNVYDFPARRQNFSQGRWVSPDPAGRSAVTLTNPQTWNRYAYSNNNPLSQVDPSGTTPCSAVNVQTSHVTPHDAGDDCGSMFGLDNGSGGGSDSGGGDYSSDNGNTTNANCDAQCQIDNAEQLALWVLQNNSNCAAAIGGDAAVAVLEGIMTGTGDTTTLNSAYLQPTVGPNNTIIPAPVAQTTSGQPNDGISSSGNFAVLGFQSTITINISPDSQFMNVTTGFYLGLGIDQTTFQAVTILHELGHAVNQNYQFDPSQGQSAVQPDNNGSGSLVSLANTAAVANTCFGNITNSGGSTSSGGTN